MTEEDTDGFIVTFALNAAGSKAVAETMKAHFGKTQLVLEFVEVGAIGAGFGGRGSICENKEITADYLLQGAYQRQEVTGHWNLPDGVLGFGFVDD